MKKITALLVLLCFALAGFSQRVYFVYLQSEGAQPFFLKMDEQVHSSNSSGYLILSQLKDSTYTFSIGFPQNKWPEQIFSLTIAGRDMGYLLKNTADKNWGLVDLQTEQQIDGQPSVKQRTVRIEEKEVSVFTDVLSKAANDPSLKQRVIPIVQPVAKKEEKPVVTPAAIQTEATPLVAGADKVSDNKKEEEHLTKDTVAVAFATPVPEQQAKPDSGDQKAVVAAIDIPVREPVIKHDTIQKKESVAAAAVNDTVVKADTSVIEKKTLAVAEVTNPEAIPGRQDTTALQSSADTMMQTEAQPKKEEQTGETPLTVYKPSKVQRKTESSTTEGFGVTYVDEYADGRKDTVRIMIPNPKPVTRNMPPPQEDGIFLPMDSDAKDLTPAKKETAGSAKNNCTNMASETDYLKLRKKMVATDGDDAMLAATKKIFKTKCFTTEQVRNLGTLFLNDAGRYNFFDAAYLAVSDRENFGQLESELKDAYYISRFKAMLR